LCLLQLLAEIVFSASAKCFRFAITQIRNRKRQETLYGFCRFGLFGFSHMMGGFAGGQAEYARVPFADVGPLKVPDSIEDEKVLFLSDIFPTGFMAADNCNIKAGDTVAIWGAGPVGQFAIKIGVYAGRGKSRRD
jgi:threonine dehydrogenase-like Zn-dependent dehydrogenase